MQLIQISKKVGKDGDNREEDVKKIQTILNMVKISPHLEENGHCDHYTLTAIGNFQRIWSQPDYRVDPGGKTLQRLNDTVKPLILKKIELCKKISYGGYAITYKGFVPPKRYRVMLYLLSTSKSFLRIPDDSIDITKTGLNNKETKVNLKFNDTLPKFLRLITRENGWGISVPCKIYLVRENGIVVSESNEVSIQCPVKPYDKRIQLNMAEVDPPMYYTGKKTGRYFWPKVIDGKRYFAWLNKFETDPMKRGFDCSTFVGTILKLPLSQLGGSGAQLAHHAKTKECEFEYEPGKKKKMKEINREMLQYFFTNNPTGAFIVWATEKHVVLVVDNVVHEFNIPVGPPGYYKQVVGKRRWSAGNIWNIKRIPSGKI